MTFESKQVRKKGTVSTEQDFNIALTGVLPGLERFAMALCSNPALADDLLQSTCERALSRRHQFESGTSIQSWLFSIMHSIWKNEMRRLGNQSRVHSYLSAKQNFFDGEKVIAGKIELSQVLLAMKNLSTDQAAAITLVSLNGMTYKEAANVLGIAQGTLESRIGRGRIALGRMLDRKKQE